MIQTFWDAYSFTDTFIVWGYFMYRILRIAHLLDARRCSKYAITLPHKFQTMQIENYGIKRPTEGYILFSFYSHVFASQSKF